MKSDANIQPEESTDFSPTQVTVFALHALRVGDDTDSGSPRQWSLEEPDDADCVAGRPEPARPDDRLRADQFPAVGPELVELHIQVGRQTRSGPPLGKEMDDFVFPPFAHL